jgi:hypothetical protein
MIISSGFREPVYGKRDLTATRVAMDRISPIIRLPISRLMSKEWTGCPALERLVSGHTRWSSFRRTNRNRLAHAIGVPPDRIRAVANGMRSVTAETDLRLSKFFCLSEGYFLRP